jgi:hypothetical protein
MIYSSKKIEFIRVELEKLNIKSKFVCTKFSEIKEKERLFDEYILRQVSIYLHYINDEIPYQDILGTVQNDFDNLISPKIIEGDRNIIITSKYTAFRINRHYLIVRAKTNLKNMTYNIDPIHTEYDYESDYPFQLSIHRNKADFYQDDITHLSYKLSKYEKMDLVLREKYNNRMKLHTFQNQMMIGEIKAQINVAKTKAHFFKSLHGLSIRIKNGSNRRI